METINVSLEGLATLLNMQPGEIADALKDSDQMKIDSFLKTKIGEKINSEVGNAVATAKTRYHDEGYGRAKREVLTATEDALRSKYGVTGTTVEEIVENVSAKIKTDSGINKIENVKDSDEFKDMEKRYQDRIKVLETDLDKERTQRTKDSIATAVGSKLESIVSELNYLLPEDAGKKAAWLKIIQDNLEDENTILSVAPDGKPIVLDKSGKAKLDDHMKEVTFDNLVNNVASRFLELNTDDGRSGTGNKPIQKPGGVQKFDFSNIKSPGDYIAEMGKIDFNKPEDEAKAKALEEWYSEEVAAGKMA